MFVLGIRTIKLQKKTKKAIPRSQTWIVLKLIVSKLIFVAKFHESNWKIVQLLHFFEQHKCKKTIVLRIIILLSFSYKSIFCNNFYFITANEIPNKDIWT